MTGAERSQDNGPKYKALKATTKCDDTDPEDNRRIRDYSRRIQDIDKERESVQRDLNDLKQRLGTRQLELDAEIWSAKEEASKKQEELDELTRPPSDIPTPSGPECLWWCMSEYFNLLSTCVIIANLTCMVIELTDKAYTKKFFWYDQGFMAFYVFEIGTKAAYMRMKLFWGSCSFCWWNWLDAIIVVSGVFDMWCMPVVSMIASEGGAHHQSGGGIFVVLRALRGLRLLRIVKIIGLFLKSDLSWTEGARFQMFIMGVIGFNAILMGFEADMPGFFLWPYVEQVLLVIFSFEISVRLKRWGFKFFYHPEDIGWNLLDFTIVAGGVVDMWLMPSMDLIKQILGMPHGGKSSLGQVMMLLRMARLLRILRLVRLVKNIPPLYTLVVGIVQAMQGMIWVMVLTMLTLYVFGLLCVKIVGHGLVFGGQAPEEIQEIFPTVTQATFNLFKAMNGDWGALEPLFYEMKSSVWFFMIYMIISSWALLSILMAVVSENLLNATEKHSEEVEAEETRMREQRSEVKLKELFQRADDSRDGDLKADEFHKLTSEPNVAFELLDAADMAEGSEQQNQETLHNLFMYLSHIPVGHSEQDAKISQSEFIEGLKDERKPVYEKSALRLEKRLLTLEKVIRKLRLLYRAGKESPTAGQASVSRTRINPN